MQAEAQIDAWIVDVSGRFLDLSCHDSQKPAVDICIHLLHLVTSHLLFPHRLTGLIQVIIPCRSKDEQAEPTAEVADPTPIHAVPLSAVEICTIAGSL